MLLGHQHLVQIFLRSTTQKSWLADSNAGREGCKQVHQHMRPPHDITACLKTKPMWQG
jgi:hypothetical protein